MKKLITFFALLLIVGCARVMAIDWTGSGTLAAPYQITTAAELATLATNVNAATGAKTYAGIYFKLMNDISLATINPWVPIGNNLNTYFMGFFDGNNKKITGLTITGTHEYFGLFGQIRSGCEIKDLTIENCSIISASYGDVGALVGYGTFDDDILAIRITNCHSSGSVEGKLYVGGLIGNIEVLETGNGSNDPGNNVFITYCSSSANVSGSENYCYVGGLAGMLNRAAETPLFIISNCFATGNVSTNNKAPVHAGGLIGYCGRVSVTNCYAKGTISATGANSIAGGFMGTSQEANIEKCFSTGAVIGTAAMVLGFLASATDGTYTSCYWNTETSGKLTSAGGTGIVGKTTLQMQTQSTFTGWDFVTAEPIWKIDAAKNDGYPHLAWQVFGSGGTPKINVTATEATVGPTDYSTLKAAFDAINAGTHGGTISVTINASTTETETARLFQSGYTGTGISNYASVTIYPTVTGLSITGNLDKPLIDLDGADGVTID